MGQIFVAGEKSRLGAETRHFPPQRGTVSPPRCLYVWSDLAPPLQEPTL